MWLRAVDGIQGGGPFAKTSGVCAPGAKDRVALAQCMHDHAIVFEMAHGAGSVCVSGLKMKSTLDAGGVAMGAARAGRGCW